MKDFIHISSFLINRVLNKFQISFFNIMFVVIVMSKDTHFIIIDSTYSAVSIPKLFFQKFIQHEGKFIYEF